MRVSRKYTVQGQRVLGISKSIEAKKRKPQPHKKRRPANPPATLAFRQRKQRSNFLWPAPLSFDWSPHLRLTCGPAGNRTTTGSLSASSRTTPYQLLHRDASAETAKQTAEKTTEPKKRGQSPNKNTHRIDLPLDAVANPLHHNQKHAKNELCIAAAQADMKTLAQELTLA